MTPFDADEKDRLALFELLYAAAGDAAELAGGFVIRDFCVGGQLVRLRFAGPALVGRFCRAFAHLAAPPSDVAPDLTICLWDSASTGRKLPLLIVNLLRLLKITWSDIDIRGELRAYNQGRLRAMLWWPDMLEVMDLARGVGVFWIDDARAVPYYESGAPLRGMLHWWFSGPQRQLVHGGAVGTPEGGVLLGGVGGAGKSTTALACLDSPLLLYAGDDYTLVSNGPAPFVHSLYNTAKVKTGKDLQARFGHLAGWVTNPDGVREAQEKPLMFVHEHRPDKVSAGFPLKALVFPRYVGQDKCQLAPLGPGSAFKALAPSTITQTPGAGAETMRALAALVRRVPSYLFGVSSDVRAIPDALCGLLARL